MSIVTFAARPHLLWVWRACLVFAALILAFASSIVLHPGSGLWWAVSCALAAAFFCCYLFYLPARQRGLSLTLDEENLVVRSGVLSTAVRTVPLRSVQYVRRKSSPLHRRLNLCALEVVCAGGRVTMPGLSEADAEMVVGVVFGERGL